MPSPAAPPHLARPGRRAVVAFVALTCLALASCSTGGSSSATPTTTSADRTSTTTDRTTATGGASSTSTTPAPDPTVPADRPIDVHVPPSYRKGTPAPLLVLLHGYSASGELQAKYLGIQAATDAAGMLFVAPDGTTNVIGMKFWNATDACCAKGRDQVDDSTYLLAVIDQVKAEYDVDPNRVFVVGHSNGGFMSYRMACDHADVIAAIVSLEGATYEDPADCTPSEPVSTLEVHGTADETIAYDGGEILGRTYPGAEQTVATWAAYDGCSSTPDDPVPASRQIVKGLAPATVTSYSDGCGAGGHAELWTQPDGTHIPEWTDDFSEQVVAWLQAHPKP